MNLTLSEEDRKAVDLLLDEAATASAMGNGKQASVAYAVTDPSVGQRVARTYKLVQLLEALPQLDPPADLVERTLKYVENASMRSAGSMTDLLGAQRPII
jgi:hypothetical protein